MIVILALTASAFNFMVDGIAYNYINSPSGGEVEVTNGGNYSGELTIPSMVTYNGTAYSVTSIGIIAFKYSRDLTSVTIPNSVTSIGWGAFEGCVGLTSVTIPNSVSSIGMGAFAGCSSLTSITIPNSVTSMGELVFASTPWFNNQPYGLVYAGLVAYKYKGTMPANTKITLRDDTKGIAGSAFYRCSDLTSVTIPNSVISIGSYAFYECTGLTSVTIPNSVTSIGDCAFQRCSNIEIINCKIKNPDAISIDNPDLVFRDVPSNIKLKVPIGTCSYYNRLPWNSFNIVESLWKSNTIGDLNEDDLVNGEDINLLVELIIRKIKYENIDDEDGAADLNGDGVVNGIDLHEMINIILGI